MRAVEQRARGSNVEVIWVNPPRARPRSPNRVDLEEEQTAPSPEGSPTG